MPYNKTNKNSQKGSDKKTTKNNFRSLRKVSLILRFFLLLGKAMNCELQSAKILCIPNYVLTGRFNANIPLKGKTF